MNINEASLDVNVNEILSAEFRDEVKLDSDSDEDDSFQVSTNEILDGIFLVG